MKKRVLMISVIMFFIMNINLVFISAKDCRVEGSPLTGGWVCNDITGVCEKPCFSFSDCNDNDPCTTESCIDNQIYQLSNEIPSLEYKDIFE